MRHLLALPLAAAVLAAAGCGSSSGEATTSTAASGAAAKPEAGGGASVSLKGIQFSPRTITVKVGQKVTWTDLEDIPHNVVAEKGADFQSSTFGRGKTYTWTPRKAGTVRYVCTIHPGMEGTITVEG